MTETATQYAVFDLDGTLADNEHRVSLIRGEGKPDWDTYHKKCVFDTPIEGIIEIARTIYHHSRAEVIILTGRVDSVRKESMAWLNRWHVPYDHLIMREAADRSPDIDFKYQVASRRIGLKNILFAVEDRKRVVDMWRRNDVLCLHCAEGEF